VKVKVTAFDRERVIKAIRDIDRQHTKGKMCFAAIIDEAHEVDHAVVRAVMNELARQGVFNVQYYPVHRHCGRVIDAPAKTKATIQRRIDQEHYGRVCFLCHEDMDGNLEVSRRLIYIGLESFDNGRASS